MDIYRVATAITSLPHRLVDGNVEIDIANLDSEVREHLLNVGIQQAINDRESADMLVNIGLVHLINKLESQPDTSQIEAVEKPINQEPNEKFEIGQYVFTNPVCNERTGEMFDIVSVTNFESRTYVKVIRHTDGQERSVRVDNFVKYYT